MTLPASGAISFSQLATELGRGGTSVSLNQADVLDLAGKSAGQAVVFPTDFYGKTFTPTFSPGPGTYYVESQIINASRSVTWTYTGNNQNTTVDVASGTASAAITFSQQNGNLGVETTATVSVTATWSGGSATWTLYLTSPGV